MELPETAVGPRTEDAVLLAGIEAEDVQESLEFADVVAAEGGGTQVQGSIAEPVAGLHQLLPRVRAEDPVGGQRAGSLERSDGGLRGCAVHALELVGIDVEARAEQAMLHVTHGLASVAGTDQVHVRSFRVERGPGNRVGLVSRTAVV